MPDDPFVDDLSARIEAFAAEVEREVLPALKTNVANLKFSFDALIGLLKKKGHLTDDPYQYNEKISDITPVATEPFLENQKQTVVSIRMHNFELQLAFLADFYQFSLDHLSLGQLRSISQFLRYVKWDSLTENHGEGNTKAVAELVGKIRKSEDTVSAGLANDLVHQLSTATAKIYDGLKKVTTLKREDYKLLVRRSFWDGLRLAPEEYRGNPDNILKKVKVAFAQNLKGQPFVPELIKELLEEDLAPNAGALREELFQRIAVRRPAQAKVQPVADPKVEFMESVRTLASANVPLDGALRKLHDNTALLPAGDQSFGEKFQAWIRKLLNLPGKPKIFPIDLFDPGTGATKREPLEFDAFVAEVQGRIRVLGGVANRNGPAFQTLAQRGDDEIQSWFDRQFIDLAKTVERLNGLDLFFKTEVPKDKRAQVKGVKAEVAQIRTVLGNANKMRHEAVARQEEQEQLKRLGIR